MPVWSPQTCKPGRSTKVGGRRACQRAELPQLPPRCAGGRAGPLGARGRTGKTIKGCVSLLGLIPKARKQVPVMG